MTRWSISFLLLCAAILAGCSEVSTEILEIYNVEGHITDAHGQPLPNVPVSYTGKVSGTTTTDGGGRFQIVGLMGEVEIAPAWDGWTFTPTSTTVTGQSESVDFSGVTGSDPLFIPVSAELVRLYDPNPKGEPAVTWELSVDVDNRGAHGHVQILLALSESNTSEKTLHECLSSSSIRMGRGFRCTWAQEYAPDDPTLPEYESLDVEVYSHQNGEWVLTGTMTVEPTKRIVPRGLQPPKVTRWRLGGGATSLQTGVYTAAYLQIYVSDISLDDEGVVGYRLYAANKPNGDFELRDETKEKEYLSPGPLGVGVHYFRLASVTADGRVSALSDTYTVEVVSDDVAIAPVGRIRSYQPIFHWIPKYQSGNFALAIAEVIDHPLVPAIPGRASVSNSYLPTTAYKSGHELHPGKWRWNIILLDATDPQHPVLVISAPADFEIL